MLESLLGAFGTAFSPGILLVIVIGTALGIIFGTIPGLSATMAIALSLPLTYAMDPTAAMALLMGLYLGGISGGLVAAILLNIPGTSSSIATTFDGHPMAQNGQAGKALSVAILSSFLSGLLAIIALMLLAPVVTDFAIKLGPHEYFSLAVFAVAMIAILSSGAMVKGLAAGAVGIGLAMVGTAPVDGTQRFTFGIETLNSGFDLLPVLIGLFAVAEILKEAERGVAVRAEKKYSVKGFGITLGEFFAQKWNFLRSWAIGLGVGILPGMGGGTSNLLSYAAAKSTSKSPEKFGKGTVDGVVASESSNNASIGGALIPLLTLGIPGDTVTAMLLGGLLVQGLTPGPLLMTNNEDIVYGIYAALLVANVVMLILMFFGRRVFLYILAIPKYVLLPVVMVLCIIGAYGANNRMFDVVTVLIFGVLGFMLVKGGFPLPPLLLGFILSPIIEENYSQAMMLSSGNWADFMTRPISGVFLLVAITVFVVALVRNNIKSVRSVTAKL